MVSAHTLSVAKAAAGGHERETNSVGATRLPAAGNAGEVLEEPARVAVAVAAAALRVASGPPPSFHGGHRLPRASPLIRLCLNEKHKGKLPASSCSLEQQKAIVPSVPGSVC